MAQGRQILRHFDTAALLVSPSGLHLVSWCTCLRGPCRSVGSKQPEVLVQQAAPQKGAMEAQAVALSVLGSLVDICTATAATRGDSSARGFAHLIADAAKAALGQGQPGQLPAIASAHALGVQPRAVQDVRILYGGEAAPLGYTRVSALHRPGVVGGCGISVLQLPPVPWVGPPLTEIHIKGGKALHYVPFLTCTG